MITLHMQNCDTADLPDAAGLPKTRSGKIMRRVLRKIAAFEESELGDTSTLAVRGQARSSGMRVSGCMSDIMHTKCRVCNCNNYCLGIGTGPIDCGPAAGEPSPQEDVEAGPFHAELAPTAGRR